ncbi:hypothetical protein [Myxococcus sp. CA040A]|uniref:hypothetical protein n=1 Tax=Myxococcus sp. CA040A TaxID=2741738 RepID=UPI00157A87BF|nr:hypothetical protein [Myxococcus sp. CA040A]NTX02010.1 hypothetical protein [Myxococcus sp. CA040A]
MRLVVSLVVFVSLVGCGAHSSGAFLGDAAAPAPSRTPVDDAELLRVQARARYIVEAERAAIRATDVLMESKDVDLSPARMQMHVTLPHEGAWYGLFGRVDDAGTFIPAYALKAPHEEPEWMELIPVDTLPVDFSPVARAVKTAKQITVETFGRTSVNPVVVREASGDITVYTLQGTRDPKRFFYGGDFRFRFAPDGRTLREQVKLHPSVIAVDVAPITEDASRMDAHLHQHFKGPLETELALLMLYPELTSLAVGHVDTAVTYVLFPDGSISVVTEDNPATRRDLLSDGTFAPAPDAAKPPEPEASHEQAP